MSNILNEFISYGKRFGLDNVINSVPNPDKIMQKTGSGYKEYRELLYDSHLWSCIQSRKAGSLATDYTISGKDTEIVSDMIAELNLKELFDKILDSILFGFQPMEIYWKDGEKYIMPSDIKAKPQELFSVNKSGELGLKDFASGRKKLPDYKFLDVRSKDSFENPYGEALLSKCYWPVKFKNGGIRFWVNFAERYGMPMLIGNYQRGASKEEITDLAKHLAEMTEDSVIVSPADIEMRMEEPHRYSSVRLYSELIKLCNAEISKAILSQTLTTEINVGSKAAAETHYKIRQELIYSDIRLVENTINTLIDYIAEVNSISLDAKFRFISETEDTETKLNRDLQLYNSGAIKFKKEYWMREYGYSEEDLE